MAFYLEEETDVVFEISVVSVFLDRFFLSVWIILLSYSNFKRRESHRLCYPGRNNEHFGSNRCFSSQATTCESHSSKTGDETELDNYWQISFLSVFIDCSKYWCQWKRLTFFIEEKRSPFEKSAWFLSRLFDSIHNLGYCQQNTKQYGRRFALVWYTHRSQKRPSTELRIPYYCANWVTMVTVELLTIGSIRIWMTVSRLVKLELAFIAK